MTVVRDPTDKGSLSVRVVRRYDYRFDIRPGGLFSKPTVARDLGDSLTRHRRFVVMDEGIEETWGDRLRAYFHDFGADAAFHVVPRGERAKTAAVAAEVLDAVLSWGLNRRNQPLVGIGGGAALDLTGYVASKALRGVDWIAVPCSLVAMGDTALGAKVAINYEDAHGNLHKNKAGSFHPAKLRVIDPSVLSTLPEPMMTEGLLELVKAVVMLSESLTKRLYRHAEKVRTERFSDDDGLSLFRAIAEKIVRELASDLFEVNLARLLDYGHTFAHAIEGASHGGVSHGVAVGHCMAVSTVIAEARDEISERRSRRLLDLLRRVGMDRLHSEWLTPELVRDALDDRTRHRGGRLRMVLPKERHGGTFVDDVEPAEVMRAVDRLARLDERDAA